MTKQLFLHSLRPSDIFAIGYSLDDTTPSTLSPSVTWIHKKESKCLRGSSALFLTYVCVVCLCIQPQLWCVLGSESNYGSNRLSLLPRPSDFPQTSLLTSAYSAMSPLHMGGGLQHLLHLDYPLCDCGAVSPSMGAPLPSFPWQGS